MVSAVDSLPDMLSPDTPAVSVAGSAEKPFMAAAYFRILSMSSW